MAFRLAADSIRKAIAHLCKFGDTDVFPHLPELAFFRDESSQVVDELRQLDLDAYNPSGAIEALAPKSRFGFRITHQLSAVDTLLLLAAVIEIGDLIEHRRLPATGIEAFSYRFTPNDDESIFLPNHTYKDWLHVQQARVQGSLKLKQVVFTDISDFYSRVSFHRLDNLLDEAAPSHGAARYIKKSLKFIRARQSFGLPVGGTAARILAELALADTDNALADHGISSTRFVDDFRIFLGAGDSPYDALGFLAQQLSINEGLGLNASKTRVYSRQEFLGHLESLVTDISTDAEGNALGALTANIYFDDAPDPADVETLKALNLLEYLQKELDQENYDMGRVKVLFRALRITKPQEAIDYISNNFSELLVFSKEVTLLMQAIENDYISCFDNLAETVVESILQPPASSVQLIRTWSLELFVRGVIAPSAALFRRLESLPTVTDKRQLHIIRSRLENKNYFRQNKTSFDQMSQLEQSAFVTGASCLPRDEYETWLQMIKPSFTAPTGHLFLRWLQTHKDRVILKLARSPQEATE